MSNPDVLQLECAPLHTETSVVAAQAPAQVQAACKRGALVIGFTEVHTALSIQLRHIAGAFGYSWLHGDGDTAIAYKDSLTVVNSGEVHVIGTEYFTFVTVEWKGNTVTVIDQHWHTNNHVDAATIRAAQTQALVNQMKDESRKARIAFYMGDTNPNKPLSDKHSDPRAALDKAGLPLVYEELGKWPNGIGVTAIGRNSVDKRVKAHGVLTHPALGSDHIPVTAFYDVAVS